MLGVEFGKLQDALQRGLELADFLVHGNGLDRESLAGIGIAYILETIGSLLDLAEAGVEVADSVGHRQILGIIFKDLFVFRDGALQLALLDILLRSAEDLLLVESETKRHI